MEYLGCENCPTHDCQQCVLVTDATKDTAKHMQLMLTMLEPGLIRAQLLDDVGDEWDSYLVGKIVIGTGKAVYEKPPG